MMRLKIKHLFYLVILILLLTYLSQSLFQWHLSNQISSGKKKQINNLTRILECRKYSDLTEYCLYENACLHRKSSFEYFFLFVTDNKAKDNVEFKFNGYSSVFDNFEPSDPFGNVIEPSVDNNPLPHRSMLWNARYVSTRYFDRHRTLYENECHAVLAIDVVAVQIFHWAIKVAPLFIYRYENRHNNQSLCKRFNIKILNRMQNVYRNDWQDKFLRLAANIESDEQIEYDDSKSSQNGIKCYRRLLVPGMARYIFTGPTESIEFRKEAANRHGLVYERRRVVLVLRRDRLILNKDELVKFLTTRFGADLVDVTYLDKLTFEQQVKLMSKAKLLISVHGAALTNVIFMPKLSALVEILPPYFPLSLYERIALHSYLHYFKFLTDYDPAIHNSTQFEFCANTTNIYVYKCFETWRDANVFVDMAKFSDMLKKVLEIVQD